MIHIHACSGMSELKAECDKLHLENLGYNERVRRLEGECDEWRGLAADFAREFQMLKDIFNDDWQPQLHRNDFKWDLLEAYSKLANTKGG